MHIYQGHPPPIDNRSMEYHYTMSLSDIAECTYTYGRCTSPFQLTIDVWYTATPQKFHM